MFRFANNVVLLTIQNIAPPVFPLSGAWDRALTRHTPPALREKLEHSFEPAGAHWTIGELQVEESAGLGFGVSALALLTFVGALFYRQAGPTRAAISLVIVCAWISLFVFMTKSGVSSVARIITPYYALLLPAFLLVGNQPHLIRTRWWRAVASLVFVMAAVLLVISPARPLWPANSFLARSESSQQPLLQRAKTVYYTYSGRSDAFAPARRLLPPDLHTLGFVSFDDPETSLWRPFFHRRIIHITHTDSLQDLQGRNIKYVLANTGKFQMVLRRPLDQWLNEMHARIIAETILPLRASSGPSSRHAINGSPAILARKATP